MISSGVNPVNRVYLSGKVAIVEDCVVCQQTHRHGLDYKILTDGESPRSAHCPEFTGVYRLRLADDEEPEDWQIRWARSRRQGRGEGQ